MYPAGMATAQSSPAGGGAAAPGGVATGAAAGAPASAGAAGTGGAVAGAGAAGARGVAAAARAVAAANGPQRGTALATSPAEPGGAQAPVERPGEEEDTELLKGPVSRLPVELDVTVPLPEFRLRDLLALEPGQVIESKWGYGDDVPLAAGEVQLAWSEFEVIDNQLAVRITRLP